MDYYQSLCSTVYGLTGPADVDGTNNYYGGLDIAQAASNIFFTNGVEDPWRRASVGLDTNVDNHVHSVVIDCPGCGHCQDLHTPDESDHPYLKSTRFMISEFVASLIGESSNKRVEKE